MCHRLKVAAIAVAVGVSGCAIQPVPEHVTGVSTYNIARQVRCEAREAVVTAVASWLTREPSVSPQSRAIGAQLLNDELSLERFSPAMLAPAERQVLALFWDTGVAYDYVLEAEEVNNLNGEINLLRMFTGNTGTLGLKAGMNRSRLNTRTFTLTDTFAKLVREIPDKYCERRIVEENFIYPMAGKVGVDKVLRDFVNLTLFANLVKEKQPDGPPTYVVALDFETLVTGSAAPKVEFSPVRSVTEASLTGVVSRKDTHKLTLGLAISTQSSKHVGAVRSEFFAGPFLTARVSTKSEADAANAVSQYKAVNIFNPRRAIVVVP